MTRTERSIAAKERRIKQLRREVAELQAQFMLLKQKAESTAQKEDERRDARKEARGWKSTSKEVAE